MNIDKGELQRLLDEAFERWSMMTGFDPEAKYWTDIDDQAEKLQEARQLDTSGLTAFMLMKAYVQKYIKNEKISCLDLVRGLSVEQAARVDLLREMLLFLERPRVDAILEKFIESIRSATKHYNVDHDDLEAWLENYYWLAILRRDAMRAMENLEVHQFYHGKSADTKMVMGSKVMEFWNIPSLVRGMQAMGQRGLRGVNLCLIRDPLEGLHSFFVLAVVNGESLTILTDRSPEAHPGARHKSRRPDKSFVRRSGEGWFPYELLKIETNADQSRLFAAKRDQLVPINAKAVALTDFSELHPADVIWLSLLFKLIADRFLMDNDQLPEMSYTTEMIRSPQMLLSARPEIVPHSTYEALEAPNLKLEDITAEKTKEQWESEPIGHNEWMIDRYGADVPEAVFNVIGDKELQELPENIRPTNELDIFDRPVQSEVVALDPLGFGTKEQVENDRVWTARRNLCLLVRRAANKEYEETKDEVMVWYRERIEERRAWLIEQSVRGKVMVKRLEQDHSSKGETGWADWHATKMFNRNLIKVRFGKEFCTHINYYIWRATHLDATSQYLCAVTGAKTISYHAIWRPERAEELPIILGVPFEDMPWQLQNWCEVEKPFYTGNSILDRLDPSDWVLRNPWCGLELRVIVHLSKRAVNAERKRLGLPRFNWKEQEEKQSEHDAQPFFIDENEDDDEPLEHVALGGQKS